MHRPNIKMNWMVERIDLFSVYLLSMIINVATYSFMLVSKSKVGYLSGRKSS